VRFIDSGEIAQRLSYERCIPLMREVMAAYSAGRTRQLLRSILPLTGENLFGVMTGALAPEGAFGAKLISVFPDNFTRGGPSHQGVVVLFHPESGAPVCVAEAGEITAIRTAAASAMATDELARVNAHRLTVFGYGRQADEHIRALRLVRRLDQVTVWGRDFGRAQVFAARIEATLNLAAVASADAREAVAEADIVCTLTPASEPILFGEWVRPGTHVNLVGAGHAGQCEADADLVVSSRFIVDSREGVIAQGGEFRRAQAAGRAPAIAGEIGEVLNGQAPGRQSDVEVTLYKSLGHIVQDLICAEALAREEP
jgi:ornithine cyclodeaminase